VHSNCTDEWTVSQLHLFSLTMLAGAGSGGHAVLCSKQCAVTGSCWKANWAGQSTTACQVSRGTGLSLIRLPVKTITSFVLKKNGFNKPTYNQFAELMTKGDYMQMHLHTKGATKYELSMVCDAGL